MAGASPFCCQERPAPGPQALPGVSVTRILEYLSGWFTPAEQFSFAKR